MGFALKSFSFPKWTSLHRILHILKLIWMLSLDGVCAMVRKTWIAYQNVLCHFFRIIRLHIVTLLQLFESIGLNYAANEIENIFLFMSILHLAAILLTVIASVLSCNCLYIETIQILPYKSFVRCIGWASQLCCGIRASETTMCNRSIYTHKNIVLIVFMVSNFIVLYQWVSRVAFGLQPVPWLLSQCLYYLTDATVIENPYSPLSQHPFFF